MAVQADPESPDVSKRPPDAQLGEKGEGEGLHGPGMWTTLKFIVRRTLQYAREGGAWAGMACLVRMLSIFG